MNISQLYTQLTALPLFKGISGDELAIIVDRVNLRWINIRQDQVFIQQDEPCQHMAILTQGEMVRMSDRDDKTYTVHDIIKAPAVIEVEQLYGLTCRYQSQYTAYTSCSVLLISKDDIRQTLLNVPVWRTNLLNHLAAFISKTKSYDAPHELTLEERIERFGLDMQTALGRPHRLRIRMEDLGRYLGESRRTISHALHNLEHDGKVILHPNVIDFN